MSAQREKSLSRWIDELERYLSKANEAYRRRHLRLAERYSLLASDRLQMVISVSPPELQSSRVDLLEEIGDFVESIQIEMEESTKVQGKRHSTSKQDQSKKEMSFKFRVEEKPSIRLADVAGMHGLKELIRTKLILPWTHPDETQRYGIQSGAGILLYGPPGVGKSMIARAIAGEFEAAFIAIRSSDVLDSLYGQTEKNLSDLFDQARSFENCVVFLDELDGLGSDRDKSDTHMRRFVNQLLVELQGFESSLERVIVLGATNKPWLLDRALIRSGRLDEMFYIPLPDNETRHEIWLLNLEHRIIDGSIDLMELTRESEGLSGADVARICSRANTQAFRQAVDSQQDVPISQSLLLNCFPKDPIHLHQTELEQLDAFARTFDVNRMPTEDM